MEDDIIELPSPGKGKASLVAPDLLSMNRRRSRQSSSFSSVVDKTSKMTKKNPIDSLARDAITSGTPPSITENHYWKEHYTN